MKYLKTYENKNTYGVDVDNIKVGDRIKTYYGKEWFEISQIGNRCMWLIRNDVSEIIDDDVIIKHIPEELWSDELIDMEELGLLEHKIFNEFIGYNHKTRRRNGIYSVFRIVDILYYNPQSNLAIVSYRPNTKEYKYSIVDFDNLDELNNIDRYNDIDDLLFLIKTFGDMDNYIKLDQEEDIKKQIETLKDSIDLGLL